MLRFVVYFGCFISFGLSARGEESVSLPRINEGGQLIVDGKPFFVLGGELGNSTASYLEEMKTAWPKFAALHMNTILAPVYWDLIEPQEGKFDFSLVDGLIEQARANKMRLVLLWFGTWKNSMSCYAPAWVKSDFERFPRCQDRTGRGMEILSPLSEENLNADRGAFIALMQYLRETDGEQHTVLMVQVENEIGMIPVPRDYSPAASEKFSQTVPSELMEYLESHRDSLRPGLLAQWKAQDFRTEGTWEECFGPGVATEELFTAWNFASYVEEIAKAGKSEYGLPMYVNAALIRENHVRGQYPSGGPLPHLIDLWRAAAPSINLLAPDMYFPNFVEWCENYELKGNPFFIPEIGLNELTATNILYAVGQHHAIGVSPFDIESIENPSEHSLAKCYKILESLKPLIFEHQGKKTMIGITPRVDYEGNVTGKVQTFDLGGYRLEVTCEAVSPWGPPAEPKPSGSIVVATAPDEFIVAGTGTVVNFSSLEAGENVGIANIQEGEFIDGEWHGRRWLNGDQSHQGRHLRIPAGDWSIQRVRLYRYR